MADIDKMQDAENIKPESRNIYHSGDKVGRKGNFCSKCESKKPDRFSSAGESNMQ